MQENEAHRIVLPPVDPGAPALIDEVARMRKDVSEGKDAAFSGQARSASYAQEFEGLVRSKQGKKGADERSVLKAVLEASVQGAKRTKGRKRGREEDEEEE
jgi:hypothetical protein